MKKCLNLLRKKWKLKYYYSFYRNEMIIRMMKNYMSKLDKLDETDKFLETYNQPNKTKSWRNKNLNNCN
jgi:macrodomain Ter protein organizer (MatP/YcbG family)